MQKTPISKSEQCVQEALNLNVTLNQIVKLLRSPKGITNCREAYLLLQVVTQFVENSSQLLALKSWEELKKNEEFKITNPVDHFLGLALQSDDCLRMIDLGDLKFAYDQVEVKISQESYLEPFMINFLFYDYDRFEKLEKLIQSPRPNYQKPMEQLRAKLGLRTCCDDNFDSENILYNVRTLLTSLPTYLTI